MRRRLALLALAGALLACQDYRFNPVGRCTIQPGQARVSLSDVTTADVLFVVDDSFSMDPIQANLATNFGAFIDNLAATQKQRIAAGKQPFDFYIAVTTSSVLVNELVSNTCGLVVPSLCSIGPVPPPKFGSAYSYACAPPGSACGDIITNFYDTSCTTGLSPGVGQPYFAGNLVGAGSNPKVLAFTKSLNWAAYPGDAAINALIAQFGQNVQVGSCGANQEMHLEASRRAIQKALAGTAPNAGFLHPGAKLVVVWVGNEDDCSSPPASSGGLVWNPGAPSGNDACTGDTLLPAAQQKQTPVADYAAFFAGLGRPFSAAFIRPGNDLLFPNCACAGGSCGGYGPGTRFKTLGDDFRALGASVVEGSVCDPNFGTTTLPKIAELVKPPAGLTLPTTPASGVVTQLRVIDGAGATVHTCVGPDVTSEWWFVDCGSGSATLNASAVADGTTPSSCVSILKASACEPTPGQTLAAVYLGTVPGGACTVTDAGAPAACAAKYNGTSSEWTCTGSTGVDKGSCACIAGAAGSSSAACARALGGAATDWTCDGVAGQGGTCLCRTGSP